MQNLVREEKQYVNCIDGAFFLMQPPERFVNHSCDPNSFVHDFCDIASRDIAEGEEITSDYDGYGIVSFRCTCGSKMCKGLVHGRHALPFKA